MTKKRNPLPILAALLGLACGAPLAPSVAAASEYARAQPTEGAVVQDAHYRVIDAKKTYRVQERPWAQIPTGARLLVQAPPGMTEADLHRAALDTAAPDSPLSVPGAKLRVSRNGALYELHVTANVRSAALEIQRRAVTR